MWCCVILVLPSTPSSLTAPSSFPVTSPQNRAAAQSSGVPPAISLRTPRLLLGRPSPWWWPCSQCWALTPCSRSWWVVSTWEQHHLSTFILLIPRCNLCYCTIALISHTSKVMLKIPQRRLQQYMNRELPDVPAGFRKGRRTRDRIANIPWIIKKAREFQKNIYFCFID